MRATTKKRPSWKSKTRTVKGKRSTRYPKMQALQQVTVYGDCPVPDVYNCVFTFAENYPALPAIGNNFKDQQFYSGNSIFDLILLALLVLSLTTMINFLELTPPVCTRLTTSMQVKLKSRLSQAFQTTKCATSGWFLFHLLTWLFPEDRLRSWIPTSILVLRGWLSEQVQTQTLLRKSPTIFLPMFMKTSHWSDIMDARNSIHPSLTPTPHSDQGGSFLLSQLIASHRLSTSVWRSSIGLNSLREINLSSNHK